MRIRRLLKALYKKHRNWDGWQKNRLGVFLYPGVRLISAIFFTVGYLVLHIIHRIMRYGKNQIYRKIRYNLNRRGLYTFLARRSASKKAWPEAKKYYTVLLNRIRSKPEELGLINECKLSISVIDRILNIKKYKSDINSFHKQKKPRGVIFTAVSGGYDSLKLPQVLSPAFDYVIYTDVPTKGSGIFDIRPLPYFHEDNTRQARFVKTHAHQLLPDYDLAIWIDANIMILGDITPLIDEFIKSKEAIGAIRHPLRDSVFDEVKACIKYGKDDVGLIKIQAKHLEDIGYDCNDLIESNIMMFDLRNEKTSKFLTTWWSEIDKYTRRDQISLNYALDSNGVKWHHIMDRPHDSRNHPLFALVPHHVKQTAPLELENLLGSKPTDPNISQPFLPTKDSVISSQRRTTIDIVYCVYNAFDDVKLCLASIKKHRKNPSLKLIIIDDGSDKPTANFLKEFHEENKSWSQLHRSNTATGYTKAVNRGLRLSTAELVILLNSDTIVTSNWAEKMSDAVFTTPGAGVVGPLSSAASWQSIPNIKSSDNQTAINVLPDGFTPDDMNEYCERWANRVAVRVPLVHGFCFGITRAVINKVGYFDEKNFPRGYGEENDYCFRATDAGFGLVIATNTYIYHAKSKSYISSDRIKLMKMGSEKLRDLYSKERINRAVVSMQKNQVLEGLRSKSRRLYK